MPLNKQLVTKQEIFERIQENKTQIRALGVKKIGLFGSFLRSQQTASSDVDLLVEFDEGGKSFDHFMQPGFPGICLNLIRLGRRESMSQANLRQLPGSLGGVSSVLLEPTAKQRRHP